MVDKNLIMGNKNCEDYFQSIIFSNEGQIQFNNNVETEIKDCGKFTIHWWDDFVILPYFEVGNLY